MLSPPAHYVVVQIVVFALEHLLQWRKTFASSAKTADGCTTTFRNFIARGIDVMVGVGFDRMHAPGALEGLGFCMPRHGDSYDIT